MTEFRSMPQPSPARREHDKRPSSSIEVVEPAQLSSQPTSLALRYWTELRGARKFPAREEISPRAMAPFLRNIVLVRVIDGGADYEYRIVGDGFVQAFGRDFKGVRLKEVEAADPEYGHATRMAYEYVRFVGDPFALRGFIAPTAASRFSYHETIFFPLGKNDSVDHLLAVSAFMSRINDAKDKHEATSVLPDSWHVL